MLEESKKELDLLMGRYKQDVEGLKAKRNEQATLTDQFKKEFERLKHEVVWPVIVDIGNQLTQYGHDYHVAEDPAYVDAIAVSHPAVLSFYIYPGTEVRTNYSQENTPYISFVADLYSLKVEIKVSTVMPHNPGVIGSQGQFTTAEITKEFVEKEIITVLKNTLIFHPQS